MYNTHVSTLCIFPSRIARYSGGDAIFPGITSERVSRMGAILRHPVCFTSPSTNLCQLLLHANYFYPGAHYIVRVFGHPTRTRRFVAEMRKGANSCDGARARGLCMALSHRGAHNEIVSVRECYECTVAGKGLDTMAPAKGLISE